MNNDVILDLFNQDPFRTVTLSKHYSKMPFVPMWMTSMNVFDMKPIRTTTVSISYSRGKVTVLPWTERDAPPVERTDTKAKIVQVETAHFPEHRLITPGQLQDIRAYDEPDRLIVAKEKVDEVLTEMGKDHDLTLEHMLLGAARGILTSGTTGAAKLNLFNLFGIAQPTPVSFGLTVGTTDVQKECQKYTRAVQSAMGGSYYNGIRMACGADFFDALTSHSSVKAAYANWQSNSFLQANHRTDGFAFGGIYWTEYFGGVGGTPFVAPNECHPIILGAPDMYKGFFAPMNSTDWANLPGLPRYASVERLDHGKGIDVLTESDPIAYSAYPEAIIKGTL